jgi:hypothetical protein
MKRLLLLALLLSGCETRHPSPTSPEHFGLKPGQAVMIQDLAHQPYVISYSSKNPASAAFRATHTVLAIDAVREELVLGARDTLDQVTIPWSAIGSVVDAESIPSLGYDPIGGQELPATHQ